RQISEIRTYLIISLCSVRCADLTEADDVLKWLKELLFGEYPARRTRQERVPAKFRCKTRRTIIPEVPFQQVFFIEAIVQTPKKGLQRILRAIAIIQLVQ